MLRMYIYFHFMFDGMHKNYSWREMKIEITEFISEIQKN
jgi:hypothetical protein